MKSFIWMFSHPHYQGSYGNWVIKFNDFSMTFSRPILIFHDSEMQKTQPFGTQFCSVTSWLFQFSNNTKSLDLKKWNSMLTFPWPWPFSPEIHDFSRPGKWILNDHMNPDYSESVPPPFCLSPKNTPSRDCRKFLAFWNLSLQASQILKIDNLEILEWWSRQHHP